MSLVLVYTTGVSDEPDGIVGEHEHSEWSELHEKIVIFAPFVDVRAAKQRSRNLDVQPP
jgi:hypothetical protein